MRKQKLFFKICDILGINPESFADKKPDWKPSIDLSNLREKVVMFDGKPLTDDDKRAILGIVAVHMSSKV